ncbi:MAG: hypothetical protein R2685_07985 [Candidatus Nitrosocosmicus sp.]|nr:hypothetical protein [Candidatus Nitrosocosmicus sp.]
MTIECIRCNLEEHICICPDDMTFEDKFADVVRRCSGIDKMEDTLQWREIYIKFFKKYFVSDDEPLK